MGEVVSFTSGSSAESSESWLDRHRDRYFDRKWLVSAKGNRFVRLAAPDGRAAATVTIFRASDGWKWSLVRSAREGPREAFASAVEARAAAWDTLASLVEKSA